MSSTSPNTIPIALKRAAIALPLTVLIEIATGAEHASWADGTGSSLNALNAYSMASHPFGLTSPDDSNSTDAAILTIADDLEFIKTNLKLTTSELAKYLSVSRQAIYDWKSGTHIKSHNLSKIENLTLAANVIASSGLSAITLHLRRKLPGGKTMLELIAAGGDGRSAARSLVNMLQRESKMRMSAKGTIASLKPVRPSKFSGVAAISTDRE